jgi:large subunit ribosomal protein L10
MTREEKNQIIEDLKDKLNEYKNFYLADISELNAGDTSDLRRACFEKDVKLFVVKNTLLEKAMNNFDGKYEDLKGLLKNSTSIMFSDTANVPAKLIKEFRKEHDKPVLKGAYVEESIYLGDDAVNTLASLKSKEELIGDIVLILQSPAQNVISSLQSGGGKLAGILKTLSEKSEE